jgi:two-component system sensor kinase FixL
MAPPLFVIAYVVLDRYSYIEPLFGLNITPWNPAPALGLIYWLRRGRFVAPLWFAALVISEWLTRRVPEGWLLTFGLSLWLVVGYGLIGEAMRRFCSSLEIFDDQRSLLVWLGVVVCGSFFNSLGYICILHIWGLVPHAQWGLAFESFWVGDLVGISVSMPAFWILSSKRGRARIVALLLRWETALHTLLALAMLWLVFEPLHSARASHFYFLCPPLVWAAGRQGLAGAIITASILQVGVIVGAEWGDSNVHSIVEFQLLDASLALVGFFLGVVVDEQRQSADDLKRSLRLTAAGDMATALAHELNQPITALSAYGKTCEVLLARSSSGDLGADGALLRDTIRRMINESMRAADVVRRLRDYFHTGALRLETVDVNALVADATQAFKERCEARGVQLHIDVDDGASALIDQAQIGLVLRNLLSNAFDAVTAASAVDPAQVPTIRLSANILAGNRLCFSVEDNGPGVSAEIATRLFEPFVSSKSSGLGLGLVISKAIVETHGGSLWTEIGDSGVFRFEIPLSERF